MKSAPMTSEPVLLWRLHSPFSPQASECYIVKHSPMSIELRLIQMPPSATVVAPSWYGSHETALRNAMLVAMALRGDGFTDDAV